MIQDGTYHQNTNSDDAESGYYVGITSGGIELTIPLRVANLFDTSDAIRLARGYYHSMIKPDMLIGVCTHEGKAYIEPVVWVGELAPALALGNRNNQIAIVDIANKKVITLSDITNQ